MTDGKDTPHGDQTEHPAPGNEPVWTFRGYKMQPSEFNTAMVHYYRAEIQRSNVWRQRLDNTTNWAVIASSAAISFSLAESSHHYGVIILNTLLVTLFLWIEARRYRYYELWASRTRLMETDFFGAMLVPPFAPHPDWAETLAATLHSPVFSISMWEAFGRRFRRNYVWIFLVLGMSWLLKNFLHPVPTDSWAEFQVRMTLGPLPGWLVLTAGLVYNGVLFLIGFGTAGLRQATGEVLTMSRSVAALNSILETMKIKENVGQGASPRAGGRKSQQMLCLIISAKADAIADRIMRELERGVTALAGKGMHAQIERTVLLVATTAREITRLETTVKAEDPAAFVVVTPTQEVMGHGFSVL